MDDNDRRRAQSLIITQSGPFAGLNPNKSIDARNSTDVSPFATEWLNWVHNPNTGLMESRKGVSICSDYDGSRSGMLDTTRYVSSEGDVYYIQVNRTSGIPFQTGITISALELVKYTPPVWNANTVIHNQTMWIDGIRVAYQVAPTTGGKAIANYLNSITGGTYTSISGKEYTKASITPFVHTFFDKVGNSTDIYCLVRRAERNYSYEGAYVYKKTDMQQLHDTLYIAIEDSGLLAFKDGAFFSPFIEPTFKYDPPYPVNLTPYSLQTNTETTPSSDYLVQANARSSFGSWWNVDSIPIAPGADKGVLYKKSKELFDKIDEGEATSLIQQYAYYIEEMRAGTTLYSDPSSIRNETAYDEDGNLVLSDSSLQYKYTKIFDLTEAAYDSFSIPQYMHKGSSTSSIQLISFNNNARFAETPIRNIRLTGGSLDKKLTSEVAPNINADMFRLQLNPDNANGYNAATVGGSAFNKQMYFRINLLVNNFKAENMASPELTNITTFVYPILLKGTVIATGHNNAYIDIDNTTLEVLFLPHQNLAYTGAWIKTKIQDIVPIPTTNSLETVTTKLVLEYPTYSSANPQAAFQVSKAIASTRVRRVYARDWFDTDFEEGQSQTVFNNFDNMFLVDILPLSPPDINSNSIVENDYNTHIDIGYQSIPTTHRGPSILMDNQAYDIDHLRRVYEADPQKWLPYGTLLTSLKGRLFISGDKENPFNVYASGVVFPLGMPYTLEPDVSFVNNINEPITEIEALGDSLLVLTQNTVSLLSGDFASNTVRLDVVSDQGYGCLSNKSMLKVGNEAYWVSSGGLASMSDRSLPTHVDKIDDKSRVKPFLSGIYRKDQIASIYDPVSNYIYLTLPAESIFDTTTLAFSVSDKSLGMTDFAYATSSRGFYEPLLDFTVFGSYTNFFSQAESIFNTRQLMHIRNTDTLFDYTDSKASKTNPTSVQLSAGIDLNYASDFIGAGPNASSILKPTSVSLIQQYSRFNVIDLEYYTRQSTDIIYNISIFPDYYSNNKPHSSGRLQMNNRNLIRKLKLKASKVFNIKYKIETTALYNCPQLQSISTVFAPVYKPKASRWVRGRR